MRRFAIAPQPMMEVRSPQRTVEQCANVVVSTNCALLNCRASDQAALAVLDYAPPERGESYAAQAHLYRAAIALTRVRPQLSNTDVGVDRAECSDFARSLMHLGTSSPQRLV